MKEPITGTPFPGGYCTGNCLDDADCGARGYCVPGFLGRIPGSCTLRCANDDDCGRDGYRCRATSSASYCVAGPKALPDNVAGNACKSDADCGGGSMTCAMAVGPTPAPLGYCTDICSIDTDCGVGGICINGIMTVLSTGMCYKSCVPPGGCRDAYTCRAISGGSAEPHGACVPDPEISDSGVQEPAG